MPGPPGRHKSHAFRSTTEFSSLQSICGLHSSREVGRKGPKCFTPDPRDLVPGTCQRCQHCAEHADDCLCKGKDGLRRASLMFALHRQQRMVLGGCRLCLAGSECAS